MTTRRFRWASIAVLVLVVALAGGSWWYRQSPPKQLMLLPLMGLDACLQNSPDADPTPKALPEWAQACQGPDGSAAHLVESTLQSLQKSASVGHRWPLGYTLKVPLLTLLKPVESGWQVDSAAIERFTRTVRDSSRPLLLYLFSTHFSVNAPIEPVLASNPDNLAQTSAGPLPVDSYYGQAIYPWSVARTDNPITKYRSEVISALLQSMCKLPASERQRIKGISLLGEVHQLFPGFEAGMGFDRPYLVSDYSAASVAGFRLYLARHHDSIAQLNQRLGSNFASFDEINPPGKDIRTEPLTRFEEHLDAFAAGRLPISGWVYAPNTATSDQSVNIYLNGKLVASAPVHLSRQDVRTAHPEFNTADLGWRYDLDFSQLPAGIYRVDLALAQPGQAMMHLATRSISIMDRQQNRPQALPAIASPPMQPLAGQVIAFTDEPRDSASYYFNPLAREWLGFRELQVVQYLQYFNHLVAQTCFADTPRYTHQIVPQFNPSWDFSKYAVESSLQPLDGLHMGVSLYGETSYGRSFNDWFRQRQHAVYGITEFHPLQTMNPLQLSDVIGQHEAHGARFLSFFLETRWQGHRGTANPYLFSLDPDNRQYGSDRLYSSLKTLLSGP